jgi:hypothetical protein
VPIGDPMAVRWHELLVHDPPAIAWFERVFGGDGEFDASLFETSATLHRCTTPSPLLEFVMFGRPTPAPFSQRQLSEAIRGACEACGFHPAVWWYLIIVPDAPGARFVEHVGRYSFRAPLEPVMLLVSDRAQHDMTIGGLADREGRWCLVLDASGAEFSIDLHGPRAFVAEVQQRLIEAGA